MIYIDKSENTGEPRIKNKKWNWGIQPNFALGAICLKTQEVYEIKLKIKNVLRSYDSKLGVEHELKSKANYIFEKELLSNIQKYYMNIIVQYTLI